MRGAFRKSLVLLTALNSKETVAWVLVYDEAGWQVATFRALILREVVDGLLLAATKSNFFGIQIVGNAL